MHCLQRMLSTFNTYMMHYRSHMHVRDINLIYHPSNEYHAVHFSHITYIISHTQLHGYLHTREIIPLLWYRIHQRLSLLLVIYIGLCQSIYPRKHTSGALAAFFICTITPPLSQSVASHIHYKDTHRLVETVTYNWW